MKTNRRNIRHLFFEEHARQWDTQPEEEKQFRLAAIFQEHKIPFHGRVLDIGCGTGILLPVLDRFLSPGCQLIELDFAHAMLAQNRDKHRHMPAPCYLNADVHFLPLKNAVINTAVCFAAWPHFADKEKSAREIHRALAPGGYLVILHLMGSRALNRLHSHIDHAVQDDRLPPVGELSRFLQKYRFGVEAARESETLYLIVARKKS